MFETLSGRLTGIFKNLTSRGVLTQKDISVTLREIRRALLEADVALEVVRSFISELETKLVGVELIRSIKPGQMIVKLVHEELVKLLGDETSDFNTKAAPPLVYMMVGLQGAGKTTTTAKLAYRFQKQDKKKVLMASLDTRRPAAQEQLLQLGQQNSIDSLPIIANQSPLEITKRALSAARLGGYDLLILDTAGRSHIDELLMEETVEIKDIAQPHEILLVADSLMGQDAVTFAKTFDEKLAISGIILTRMDGDGRGGAALSMRHVTGKPVKAVAVGEKIADIDIFRPQQMANRILGMGDVVALVEKAAQTIDEEKNALMAQKMREGKFDLNDFAQQLKQMQRMGGLGAIAGLIPGMGAKNPMGMNDKAIKSFLAAIDSMTKYERENPEILKHSRKIRISKGSAVSTAEINKLLKMHRQMSDMMKMMKKGKGGWGLQKMLGGFGSKMKMPPAGGNLPDLAELQKIAKLKNLPDKLGNNNSLLGDGSFPDLNKLSNFIGDKKKH
ncbi:signal recognition particle protein [Bartonella sp. DGB1]|uniref:signal recognition particle protein n=1 Tax=Bartonella sp. DGB1 TaxID=3239807 RepID=UPI003524BEEF